MSKLSQKEYFDTLIVPGNPDESVVRLMDALQDEENEVAAQCGRPPCVVLVDPNIPFSFHNAGENVIAIKYYGDETPGIFYKAVLAHEQEHALQASGLEPSADQRNMNAIGYVTYPPQESVQQLKPDYTYNFLEIPAVIAEGKTLLNDINQRLAGQPPFSSQAEIAQYLNTCDSIFKDIECRSSVTKAITPFTQAVSAVSKSPYGLKESMTTHPMGFMLTKGIVLQLSKIHQLNTLYDNLCTSYNKLISLYKDERNLVTNEYRKACSAYHESEMEKSIEMLKEHNVDIVELGDKVPASGIRIEGCENLREFLATHQPQNAQVIIVRNEDALAKSTFYITGKNTPLIDLHASEEPTIEEQRPEEDRDNVTLDATALDNDTAIPDFDDFDDR